MSLYETLGCPPEASAAELRRAYRHALRAAHPDLGGNTARLLEVRDAWAVLGDENRRRTYDRQMSMSAPSNASPRQADPPPAATAMPPAQRAPVREVPPRRGRGLSERLKTPSWATAAVSLVAALTGGFVVWILTSVGPLTATAAALYLASLVVVLIVRATGLSRAQWAYTVLMRSALILASLCGLLAVVALSGNNSILVPIIWSSAVLGFTVAVWSLDRRLTAD